MSVQLHFETSGYCDAKCHFCVYPSAANQARPKGFMSWDLYRKIIDEAVEIPAITEVAIAGLGETQLDPKIVERVAYTKKARPEWMIECYTNGTHLTPERFDALRDAGLDSLSISLNAVTAEQHERVMGLKDKYELVCRNINHAISNHQGRVNILVKGVFSRDEFTEDDVVKFYTRWGVKDIGPNGYGKIVIEANWAGENRTIREFDPKSACMRALMQLAVDWTGKVLLCCFDPVAKGHPGFGDLNKQSIREIYNSDAYTQFRLAHHEGRADEYEICKNCTRI